MPPPPLPHRIPDSPSAVPPHDDVSSKLVPKIAFSVIVVCGLAFGWLAWRNYRKSILPERENISTAQKHEETKNAFSSNDSAASDAETADITAALDRFNAVLSKKSSQTAVDIYDADRMGDELDRMGVLDLVPGHTDPNFRKGFDNAIYQAIPQQWTELVWTSHKVKKVKLSDNRTEAVVYDINTHITGTTSYIVKIRWWLRKSSKGWRVWDFEALENGMRSSTLMGAAISGSGGISSQRLLAAQDIKSAAVAVRSKDWATVDANLRVLDQMSLPVEFMALRNFISASENIARGQYAKALKDCDAITTTGQDVPVVHEFRAKAYNALGNYEQALKSTGQWEETLGPDREVYYERGLALKHLNRLGEAADAFRKSLDEDADSSNSFLELSALLPATDKSELAIRFARCVNARAVFAVAEGNFLRAHDLAGMQVVLDAYRGRPDSGTDPWLDYYDAELKVLRKQYKEAEAILKVLEPQSFVKGQEAFRREYFYSAVLAGDSVDAYNSASNPSDSFRQLSRRLLARSQFDALSRLVDVRLQTDKRDPWAYYYQAQIQQRNKEYEQADDSYVKALSCAESADERTFQRARVLARYQAGDGITAYKHLTPKSEVFVQLVGLFSEHRQGVELGKLVDLRRADAPDDTTLPIWDADAKFLSGDYAASLQSLNDHPATDSDRYRWNNLYVRTQVHLEHFDEARALLHLADEKSKNWWLIAVVETTAGNVPEAIKAIDMELRDPDITLSDFYADPDMGPALKSATFADWRAAHPLATTVPTTRGVLD